MSNDNEICPFRLDTPEEAIADLRRRITTTRLPARNWSDRSQGVQLATVQELARYWRIDYDLRAYLDKPALSSCSAIDQSESP
jgi:Epoxide hydrolase N terminus